MSEKITDSIELHNGDCLTVLRSMADESVQCCVTSPPYYGLRDYGHDGQIGLEQTPDEYVAKIVEVFREVRRVLQNDGTLWLNLGDSYANDGEWGGETGGKQSYLDDSNRKRVGREKRQTGLGPKNLIGIPWMVAFAMRADGWTLRQDLIWSKPNVMPESVKDRCTKSHEYVFLFSKSKRYYFDSNAIAEKATSKGGGASFGKQSINAEGTGQQSRTYQRPAYETRNARSVWQINTKSFHGAHFAVMPPELAERCVKAGCPAGGIVLDPFAGSGTTGMVSHRNGRGFVGVELNPDYYTLAKERILSKPSEKARRAKPIKENTFHSSLFDSLDAA